MESGPGRRGFGWHRPALVTDVTARAALNVSQRSGLGVQGG